MTSAFHWGWVLGIALFLPVALPAGGASKAANICELDSHYSSFMAGHSCVLHSSPSDFATSLRTVEIGTPLKVLRNWQTSNGEEWLQVQINTNRLIEFSCSVTRGWINV